MQPDEAPMDNEEVFLIGAGEPFIVTAPRQANACLVPDQPGVHPYIRGLTFERTGRHDPDFRLPLFRRKTRQL